MPYASNAELPGSVRHHLPDHAQDIFRNAFNSAWEQYADRGDDREKVAFQVAWSAVKKSYQKGDDDWVEK